MCLSCVGHGLTLRTVDEVSSIVFVTGSCLLTILLTIITERLCQGQVSDENSYALGGVAGHAGIFMYALVVLTSIDRASIAADE